MLRRSHRLHQLLYAATFAWIAVTAAVSVSAARQAGPAPGAGSALPAGATGEEIYRATCITCHGPDGKGSPRSVVGFDTQLPDFTDCAFATAESDSDWHAVVHEGGRIRGLSHHMPSFGDALSMDQIAAAVE